VALVGGLADGFLVTLGEYRSLPAWRLLEALAREGDCSWPPSVDCKRFLCFRRRSAKSNSITLRVSLSYLT
jgi:hypothetical protein